MDRDLSSHSDAELWALTSEEPTAFAELFQRHADAVYNHCFRKTASWSTAEDLRSVVFLEAWRRRRDVRLHEESILPWLLAVANNVVRTRARSVRRHRAMLARLPVSLVSDDDPAEEAVTRLHEEAQMRQVQEALGTLTRGEQDVLALCVWAELDYAAAAIALGVPVGTVKSRLSRARHKLRQVVEREPGLSLGQTVTGASDA
ncbi:sigma-70 family RNA polymerase sigma factor [Acidothermaceae bacterium B102]|nr:sigma-70 family RNA polymerase sigma factor [Acidothermaceae bacterium B102]